MSKSTYGIISQILLLILTFLFSFQYGLHTRSFLIEQKHNYEYLDQILSTFVGVTNDEEDGGIISEDGDDDDDDDDDEEEEDMHGNARAFPASGLLLSTDYHNLDLSYLDETKISTAMKDLISQKSYILGSLLSYHCMTNKYPTKDISCYAILTNKNHIFVHGFVEGETNKKKSAAIAVDILSCDENQIRLIEDVLPYVGIEFAGYTENEDDEIEQLKNMRWKAQIRNSPEDPKGVRNPFWEDLSDSYLFRRHYLKSKVATHETIFQRIDVWDFVKPSITDVDSFFKSKNTQEESYESLHPEYYQQDRVMFLDGVSQSLQKGVEPYHEALVQPAMFAHTNPKRVAIIGGGEGATLREALKHKSVTNVTMIDIDEIMCKVSADILYPLWNGCDDFMEDNVPSSCFDHPRAHVRYEDALAWFIDRFLDEHGNEKYDVIIMDALDPQDTVEFANILYQDMSFWQSIYNALSDDGILVAQLGMSPEYNEGPDESNKNSRRAKNMEVLEKVGFVTTHSYEEAHCKFDYPWTFLLVCKSQACNQNWYKTPAQVNIAMHERILPSKSGLPLLKYFDGATMAQYRVPHKGAQTVFCRSFADPLECQLVEELMKQVEWRNGDIQNPGTHISASLDKVLSNICEDADDCQSMGNNPDIIRSKLLSTLDKLTGPTNSEQYKKYIAATDSSIARKVNSKLFYSPLLDRNLPFFGYWKNYI